MNKFKYINRHHKKDIVLLPGWATDHRIFEKLDIAYNYILPVEFDPDSLPYDLAQYLQNNDFRSVSIYGWSLGGFAGADFAVKYPYMVDELILVGVKERYEEKGIEKVEGLIAANKKAYLYKFYRECFSPQEQEKFKWFKENLMGSYLDIDSEVLFNGLEYLKKTPIDAKKLSGLNVTLVYGANDKIIPAGEIMSLKSRMPGAKFVFKEECGHLAF